MLIEKRPPRMIAGIDYKKMNDAITFTECIAYNHLVANGVAVFLVYSDDLNTFTIRRYIGGDWRPSPPVCDLKPVASNLSPADYERWERNFRLEWRKEQSVPDLQYGVAS
jgi:hypothetical protein